MIGKRLNSQRRASKRLPATSLPALRNHWSLFYYFRLEEQIPTDHLLRRIDRYVDFSFVREQLKDFYSPMGRPSIDPEVLLRLVEGRNLAVDGTLVGANASQQSRVPRQRLVQAAQISRTVQEYLKELERENPVTDLEQRPIAQEMVSSSDPDAAWAVKSGPATLGYYDNCLVDTTSRVILSVDATPARFRQEVLAAQRMIEHVSRHIL
jgi:hypothetical protein